jgi:hypothetical protein
VFPITPPFITISFAQRFSLLTCIGEPKKKKSPGNQNQGWEPIHQMYKANENTSIYNPKEKQKLTINQKKSSKDLMQKGLIATK